MNEVILFLEQLYDLLLFCTGLPRWFNGKESACQCRRCKTLQVDPWIRKIPWSRKWQRAPVFLPGNPMTEEPGRLQSMGSQRVKHGSAQHSTALLTLDCIFACILKRSQSNIKHWGDRAHRLHYVNKTILLSFFRKYKIQFISCTIYILQKIIVLCSILGNKW